MNNFPTDGLKLCIIHHSVGLLCGYPVDNEQHVGQLRTLKAVKEVLSLQRNLKPEDTAGMSDDLKEKKTR